MNETQPITNDKVIIEFETVVKGVDGFYYPTRVCTTKNGNRLCSTNDNPNENDRQQELYTNKWYRVPGTPLNVHLKQLPKSSDNNFWYFPAKERTGKEFEPKDIYKILYVAKLPTSSVDIKDVIVPTSFCGDVDPCPASSDLKCCPEEVEPEQKIHTAKTIIDQTENDDKGRLYLIVALLCLCSFCFSLIAIVVLLYKK